MDEDFLNQMQNEIDSARLNGDRQNLSRLQQDAFLEKEERSMIKEQLDLSDQLTRIDYLLKGFSLQPDSEGNLVWKEPVSEDMRVFSSYGIQLIMNTICFYLNQNTLLSNYDDEQINHKMMEFTKELIWAIFMNYEKVFLYPTVEDSIAALKERLKRKMEVTKYAYEMQGKIVSDKVIYAEKVKEIEDVIEKEIEKMREHLIKEKLKRFPLLIRVIQDTVHSTYQRAWNGQERASIRTHMSISENKSTTPNNTAKAAHAGFFNFGGNKK
jgi:hypothetical protein